MTATGAVRPGWPAQRLEIPHATPFGAMLRRWRIRKRLAQNALARGAGIDPAYVNILERQPDRPPPSRRVTLALAAALRCDAVDTDLLLIAAGHCPELIATMAQDRFRALYTVLEADLLQPLRVEASR